MNFVELEKAITLSGNLEADSSAHSSLLYQVALGAARASADADDFEYELELVYAKVQEEIRNAANKSGEKVTEALIASRVKSSEEYQQKHDEFTKLTRAAGEWKALLKAFDSRGHSLRDLTNLATRSDMSPGLAAYTDARQALAASRAAQPRWTGTEPTTNSEPRNTSRPDNARRRIQPR